MMSKEQARAIVLNHFNNPKTSDFGLTERYVYAIQDEDTIEKRYGWIFNCNTQLYFQTRNHRYLSRGHGPVVVEKHDGSIHMLGSRFNRETMIKLYELDKLPLPVRLRHLIIDIYTLFQYRKRGRKSSRS